MDKIVCKDLSSLRKLFPWEIVKIFRRKGIIVGSLICNYPHFITECGYYNVNPSVIIKFIS